MSLFNPEFFLWCLSFRSSISVRLWIGSLAACATHISAEAFSAHSWRFIFSLILLWWSESQPSVDCENVQLLSSSANVCASCFTSAVDPMIQNGEVKARWHVGVMNFLLFFSQVVFKAKSKYAPELQRFRWGRWQSPPQAQVQRCYYNYSYRYIKL